MKDSERKSLKPKFGVFQLHKMAFDKTSADFYIKRKKAFVPFKLYI